MARLHKKEKWLDYAQSIKEGETIKKSGSAPEVSPQNIIKKQCIVGWSSDKNQIKPF
ncbi:hypothetical protein SAMN05421754_103725 [Nitrosomonas sp. Nm58]|nr:hypothetical protein SAMN05421754_103725 [Nitrosomonas sp. Nm58]